MFQILAFVIMFTLTLIKIFVSQTAHKPSKMSNPTAADIMGKNVNLEIFNYRNIDYSTGLPLFLCFSMSPFLCLADYARHVRSFTSVSEKFGDLQMKLYLCRDHHDCFEYFGRSAPLTITPFGGNMSLTEIRVLIKEAIWSGYPGQPSNYSQLQDLCDSLRKANHFLVTPVLLRELIQRDCVDAYKTVMKIFGGNDYPGTNGYRSSYFVKLQRHLRVWGGEQIKVYLRSRHIEALEKGLYPSLYEQVQLLGDSYEDISLKKREFAQLEANMKSIEYPVMHCPFQATPDKGYSCYELTKYRFYDFSPVRDLGSDFSYYPLRDFCEPKINKPTE